MMVAFYQESLKTDGFAKDLEIDHPYFCALNLPLCTVKFAPEVADTISQIISKTIPNEFAESAKEVLLSSASQDKESQTEWYLQTEAIFSVMFLILLANYAISTVIGFILKALWVSLFNLIFCFLTLTVIFVFANQYCQNYSDETTDISGILHTSEVCSNLKFYFGKILVS
ncbi:unnamed protein product [Moneuplotes crassus]|uniref:Uncharacterized protein n=1 Tax=Euplotes crassus TaxID=5936 RepID=A0AAD2D353_EUPCR|nr:unnamed protein product [Moneuplotes crassus]